MSAVSLAHGDVRIDLDREVGVENVCEIVKGV